MNITIDTLVDCIFLLINSNTEETRDTIKKILKLYNEQTSSIVTESEKELSELYVKLLNNVLSQKLDKSDIVSLKASLFKLKSSNAYKENKTLLLELEKELLSSDRMSDAVIVKQHNSLKLIETEINVAKLVKKSYIELNNLSANNDYDSKLKTLKKLQNIFSEGDIDIAKNVSDKSDFMKGPTFVDFSNKESIRTQLEIFEQRTSVDNVFKTGLQGLNSMCKFGGFIPGQSLIFAAGPSKFKSGIMKKFFLWCVEYNDFKLKDPTKKAMVYFPTLENTTDDNVYSLFETIYSNQTGVMPDKNVTLDEQNEYISDYFSRKNVFFAMEKFPAGEFTVNDLKQRVTLFEKMGYEVVQVILDYLAEMYREQTASRDQTLKILLTNLCDYCKAKNIFVVSAHPFNRNYAVALEKKNGIKYVNIQHLADGPDIVRVADTVIFINIETNDLTGIKYLTLFLYKNRLYTTIPENKRYVAYPFINGSILLDDYGKDFGGVSDIYKDSRFSVKFDNDNNTTTEHSTTDVY